MIKGKESERESVMQDFSLPIEHAATYESSDISFHPVWDYNILVMKGSKPPIEKEITDVILGCGENYLQHL